MGYWVYLIISLFAAGNHVDVEAGVIAAEEIELSDGQEEEAQVSKATDDSASPDQSKLCDEPDTPETTLETAKDESEAPEQRPAEDATPEAAPSDTQATQEMAEDKGEINPSFEKDEGDDAGSWGEAIRCLTNRI